MNSVNGFERSLPDIWIASRQFTCTPVCTVSIEKLFLGVVWIVLLNYAVLLGWCCKGASGRIGRVPSIHGGVTAYRPAGRSDCSKLSFEDATGHVSLSLSERDRC